MIKAVIIDFLKLLFFMDVKENPDQKFQHYRKKFTCPEITDQDIWEIIKEDIKEDKESKKLSKEYNTLKQKKEQIIKNRDKWTEETRSKYEKESKILKQNFEKKQIKENRKYFDFDGHEKAHAKNSSEFHNINRTYFYKTSLEIDAIEEKMKKIYDIQLTEWKNSLKSVKSRVEGIQEGYEKSKKRKLEKQSEDAKLRKLETEIEKHFSTLQRNFNSALIKNEYGGIDRDDRKKEFLRFLKSIDLVEPKDSIIPQQTERYLSDYRIDIEFERLCILLEKKANESKNKGFDPNSFPRNGIYFENWVAKSLEGLGWKTRTLPASGDQGIDVIAELNNKSVGIQCKVYSTPVGNKAVQECLAGKSFYKLDYGVVITNSSYTPSAKELSAKTEIKLLNVHDIPKLNTILGIY